MTTTSQDISVLHRMFEIEDHYVNIIQASIELSAEQQSKLADLKRGETLTTPLGYTIIRRW